MFSNELGRWTLEPGDSIREQLLPLISDALMQRAVPVSLKMVVRRGKTTMEAVSEYESKYEHSKINDLTDLICC